MAEPFTEQERADLLELFKVYDYSKVKHVEEIVAAAEGKGQSAESLFNELYKQYRVQPLPNRENVIKAMRGSVPQATDEDVMSALRQTELRRFSEADAIRALERRYRVNRNIARPIAAPPSALDAVGHDGPMSPDNGASAANGPGNDLRKTISSLRAVTPRTPGLVQLVTHEKDVNASLISITNASLSKPHLDEIMAEEARDWVARVVGDTFNSEVRSSPNFVDALRNGVVLNVLLQKLEQPPVEDAKIRVPKRITGFYVRDNVAGFLTEARARFKLNDAQLFTVSDLIDNHNDRQVVTCVLSVARIAYGSGITTIAPAMVMYEREIDLQSGKFTEEELDRIVMEADAHHGQAPAADHHSPHPLEADATPEKQMPFQQHGADGGQAHPEDGTTTAKSPSEPSHTVTPRSKTTKEADGEANGTPQRGVLDTDSSAPGTPPRGTPSPAKGPREPTPMPSASTIPSPTPMQPAQSSAATSLVSVHDLDRSKEGLDAAKAFERNGMVAAYAAKFEVINDADESSLQQSIEDGHVFFLRRGMLLQHPSDLPADTDEEDVPQRSGRPKPREPRVVWKRPNLELAAAQPPRYYSRRWDGIDCALGELVNAHYEKHPESPWRFHGMATNAGEYVLYNRQNAQRRVVYVRIIQRRLFMRMAVGTKNPDWVPFSEALELIESGKA